MAGIGYSGADVSVTLRLILRGCLSGKNGPCFFRGAPALLFTLRLRSDLDVRARLIEQAFEALLDRENSETCRCALNRENGEHLIL